MHDTIRIHAKRSFCFRRPDVTDVTALASPENADAFFRVNPNTDTFIHDVPSWVQADYIFTLGLKSGEIILFDEPKPVAVAVPEEPKPVAEDAAKADKKAKS